MRYLPHTDTERAEMLATIGVPDIEALFAAVPEKARLTAPLDLPPHSPEFSVEAHMRKLAGKNRAGGDGPFFVGAGAYRHHVPATVDHLIQRSEWLTAYTPYQPEISQGTLQMLFEFQTQVAKLTGMEVANASMYDGSTATAEAVLMAKRLTRRNRIVLSGGLHPHYRDVVRTYLGDGPDLVCLDASPNGQGDMLSRIDGETAAIVLQTPDFYGHLRDVQAAADAAHAQGALLIVVVTEIVALGLIEAPGALGADIVVGDGQSIGNALNFGGPYVGLMATRQQFVRQMPGRLCGETVDADGRRGFVLTLSTREQHIRREKATSNICTNSGLCALAFSIHMGLLGEAGLTRLARLNHARASVLADALAGVPGVELLNTSFFNEITVRLAFPAAAVVEHLARRNILAGVPVSRLEPGKPELQNLLLLAATELTTDADIAELVEALMEGLVMSMNTQGRPTGTGAAGLSSGTGAALLPDEPLLFEIGDTGHSGVDLPEVAIDDSRLGGFARRTPLDLAGLTEPEAMRHYVRLSRRNYSIDSGMYPLGSCTMKHNPRLNEKTARLPGFADIHPLQPLSTVPGALEVMQQLSDWLLTLTNMTAVALTPKAGAHGEMCGMMAIRAAQQAKGQGYRSIVLVPDSAHGTNPATAAALGYSVKSIPARADGTVDVAAVKAALSPEVAAIMLTNPNTCGLFEREIIDIAAAVHAAGAYFYCDGANFNAIMGVVRPGDLGVDAMHINLHKTFSTPHGGGGPGAGPVVLSAALAPFAPVPFVRKGEAGLDLVEHVEGQHLGRITAFNGQMGMYVRALTYMLSHGGDGLAQAAKDAVLNANYIRARLDGVFTAPFGDQPCMHEALFDDHFLDGTHVSTLDFAKALIDEGYHPMTMYFPLVVHGAMLIEPTESEPKQTLDAFCDTMLALAEDAKAGNTTRFTAAPMRAPVRRMDETRAARSPILRWEPEDELPAAAE